MAHHNPKRTVNGFTEEALMEQGFLVASQHPITDGARHLLVQIYDVVESTDSDGAWIVGAYDAIDLFDALSMTLLLAIEHTVHDHPGDHWKDCQSYALAVVIAARHCGELLNPDVVL